jgi:hypothetical protein
MKPVNRGISRPEDRAGEPQEQPRALWKARRARPKKQLRQLQGYWSKKAKEKGILSERDLERYLNR